MANAMDRVGRLACSEAYVFHVTFPVSRFTMHDSRFTFHVPRFPFECDLNRQLPPRTGGHCKVEGIDYDRDGWIRDWIRRSSSRRGESCLESRGRR